MPARFPRSAACLVVLTMLPLFASPGASGAVPTTTPAPPETVIVTFRPKDGKEDDVRKLIEKQWETLVRLKLVKPETHQFYRGEPETGGGKAVFVDIFTWLSGDIPDNAPPEIQNIWNQMNEVTEGRDGRPPI